MRSRRMVVWSIGVSLIMFMIVLRMFAASQLEYGPEDARGFATRGYGSTVADDTPPFFLMWTRSDGQAFYAIANDLNGDDQAGELHNLSYRMSRIGMSAIAKALSFGNENWLTYTLPLTSLASYALLVLVAATLVDTLGLRAFLLPLTPAAILGTLYDSAESLGTLLLVVGLTTPRRIVAIAAGVLLGSSRPSYAIGLPARRHHLTPAAIAVLTGVGLQVFFVTVLRIPFSGSANNLSLPLTGLLSSWSTMTSIGRMVALTVLLTSVLLAAMAVSSRHMLSLRLTAALVATFNLCLSSLVYAETFSALRASAPALILIVLSPLFEKPTTIGQIGGT